MINVKKNAMKEDTKECITDWKDIYELPVKDTYIKGNYRSGMIHDSDGNFLFQFIHSISFHDQQKIIDCINGHEIVKNSDLKPFRYENGYIMTNTNIKIILIRGWGNLTGGGAHSLDSETATIVQDTFSNFIVEQLNKN